MGSKGDYLDCSFDLLLELVSKQSLEELMLSRLLNSNWRMAADCALFSRQDEQ